MELSVDIGFENDGFFGNVTVQTFENKHKVWMCSKSIEIRDYADDVIARKNF